MAKESLYIAICGKGWIMYEVFAVCPAFINWSAWRYVVSVNVSRCYGVLRKGMKYNETYCLLCRYNGFFDYDI